MKLLSSLLLIMSLVVAQLAEGSDTGRKPSADAPPSPRYSAPKAPMHPGPAALRLFEQREFFKTHSAPDFWALIPYYLPQEEGTCAASSLAMVVNALNAGKKALASDKLVTTRNLIANVADPAWEKSMQEKKCYDLDRMAGVVKAALPKLGHPNATVKVVHIEDQSPKTAAALRKDLTENEASGRDFIIANFLQGQFTGDPEGTGHVSPVAAYDAKEHRVLVLDVDREYYEPYWVTEEIFLAGLNTRDETASKFRGYVRISD